MPDEPPVVNVLENAALSEIAASEVMALKKRQESIAQMLAERLNAEALSNLKRKDPPVYTRLHFYLALYDRAGENGDTDWSIPNPKVAIEEQMLVLHRSIGAKIIDTMRSISHITEGAPSQRRGLFGRH